MSSFLSRLFPVPELDPQASLYGVHFQLGCCRNKVLKRVDQTHEFAHEIVVSYQTSMKPEASPTNTATDSALKKAEEVTTNKDRSRSVIITCISAQLRQKRLPEGK